jgi:hypothetical protein
VNDSGGYLTAKNSKNLAQWAWRWHLQSGSAHWSARPMKDLRSEEDMRRWRAIFYKAKRLRKQGHCTRPVINFVRWKFERERQAATRQRTGEIRA